MRAAPHPAPRHRRPVGCHADGKISIGVHCGRAVDIPTPALTFFSPQPAVELEQLRQAGLPLADAGKTTAKAVAPNGQLILLYRDAADPPARTSMLLSALLVTLPAVTLMAVLLLQLAK